MDVISLDYELLEDTDSASDTCLFLALGVAPTSEDNHTDACLHVRQVDTWLQLKSSSLCALKQTTRPRGIV